ncbi:hypothetical protein P3875_05845 [Myroides sp. JBRI-B21084]|uniref:hypothetical protein n=1 Tax=Myroides sp. JBRI-B21084 TaxID=3119977 RepID=UPI0026E38E0B|nr:hypothetical protein [Paenimyroides cloacae]WKW47576.1 hypothetical protein P3875_05845 [Paenimyroides cloacae]
MKKLLLVALIASSFMSLQSCGGEDSVAPNGTNGGGNNGGGGNTTTAILPTRITRDYKRYETFKYDDKNRIILHSKKLDNYYWEDITFNYSNDTLLGMKSIGDWPVKDTIFYTFKYSTNEVRYDYTTSKGNLKGYAILKIDNNGILLEDLLDNGTKREYFYDSNNNLIKIKVGNWEGNYSYYANTNGIFKNVNMPQWAFYSVIYTRPQNSLFNNMSKSVNNSSTQNTFNYNYKYNKDGYPVIMYGDGQDDLDIEYTK